MDILKDKVAIVTGGGSGIGEAIALLFAEEGAKVVVSDVNEEGGKRTVDSISERGGDALFIKADSSIPADSERLVEETIQHYGKLDIACNNAGVGGPNSPVGDYPIDGWQKVININLNGVFYGMRYQIPAMLKNGGGAIVNIASILGKVGFAGSAAYVAAKHGVVGLTENAALEYSAKGIRVNAVGPAFIKTPLIEKSMTEEARAQLVGLHPIGRLGESKEVAELVLWLSSEKASFVAGAYYPIDGGYLSR